MKKLLMLSVLLVLFGGEATYAQTYPWTGSLGNLSNQDTVHTPSTSPALIEQVLNPIFAYRENPFYGRPAGWFIEAGDYTAPTGVTRTYTVVIASLTGINSANDFYAYNDDWIGGGGVVDINFGTNVDWTLYSDVSFEFYEEYSDGSSDWYYAEWY